MKRIHTHYDNLKVARNAPIEVIRAAYRTLSQKYHPDRNPNNPDAARFMTLINTSYEVLSDPNKREKHDEWIREQEISNAEPHSQNLDSQPQPKAQAKGAKVDFSSPRTGECYLSSLPVEIKEKLIDRTSGKNKLQLAIRLDGIGWNYFWTTVITGWFIYLFNSANGYRWQSDSVLWHIGFTGSAAFLLAINIDRIIRWHKSKIRCWLIISPLYVIKTHIDKIWYWPIWTISDIKATHNYRNGFYHNTSLIVAFNGKSESFIIRPRLAYDSMISTLQTFDQSFRAAMKNANISYLVSNDDFLGFKNNGEGPKLKSSRKHRIDVFAYVFGICVGLFAGAYALNRDSPDEPARFYSSPSRSALYTPVQPTEEPLYVRPKTAPNGESWPTGASYVRGYRKLHADGLSSVTIDNSQNNSDVFVKLVSLDGNKSYPVRIFFIPAYGTFTVNKVRTGTYDVRYRDLDSGSLSKSESFVLREIPTYEGLQYSNVTMTLYKIRNGNMQTYSISESEF